MLLKPPRLMDRVLSGIAQWASLSLAVVFLTLAFSLPLAAIVPEKAAIAIRLLLAAYSHVALIGLVSRRCEATWVDICFLGPSSSSAGAKYAGIGQP